MLHFLSILTAFLIIFTGLIVLAFGEWRKMQLKFAGVALSTTGAVWILLNILLFHDFITCNRDPDICASIELYHVVRNTAFIIFHIAIGRDAIKFSKGERRGRRFNRLV